MEAHSSEGDRVRMDNLTAGTGPKINENRILHLPFYKMYMQFNRVLLVLLLLSLFCSAQSLSTKGVYRYFNGIESGKEVWIVDGAVIRQKIYPEFLYGGNGQRYLFEPESEIWIDNTISSEEYRYTLAHELNERDLMAKYGYTYYAAHDSSLRIERKMRAADAAESALHEKRLPKVSVYDCDSLKEIPELPDSIQLSGIYLQRLYNVEGLNVWIVNGSKIRAEIYPDFGLSGNDLAYYFIPSHEIWIDAQTSCQEIKLSIIAEKAERDVLAQGKGYDAAYEAALAATARERTLQEKKIHAKKAVRILKVPDRDKGTGTEK